MTVLTNLRVLEPSRRSARTGDIFVLSPGLGRYLFGRVVSTEARPGGRMGPSILVYIFKHQASEPAPPNGESLTPDQLLIAPLMTNHLPWMRGYFQTIAHRPAQPGDVLDRHCFVDSLRGECFDEFAVKLPRCVEPCGEQGLHSFRTIDDAVSNALGIPQAPD